MRVANFGNRSVAIEGIFILACGLALGIAACSGSKAESGPKAVATPKAAAAPAAAPRAATTPSTALSSASSAATSPTPSVTTDASSAPAATPAALPPPAPSLCAGSNYCYETGEFAATVSNFRTSVVSAYRVIDATIRFQNKTAQPLTLGYALGSGISVDEKGNRYAVGGPNGYRGIGYVNGQNVDPKFVVQPGSFADARFELSWMPGNAIVGTTFELDLTVTKINTIEGNQHTLGGEFPMMFRGLVNEAPLPTRK